MIIRRIDGMQPNAFQTKIKKWLTYTTCKNYLLLWQSFAFMFALVIFPIIFNIWRIRLKKRRIHSISVTYQFSLEYGPPAVALVLVRVFVRCVNVMTSNNSIWKCAFFYLKNGNVLAMHHFNYGICIPNLAHETYFFHLNFSERL